MKNIEFESIYKAINYLNKNYMTYKLEDTKATVDELQVTHVETVFNVYNAFGNSIGKLIGKSKIDGKIKKVQKMELILS